MVDEPNDLEKVALAQGRQLRDLAQAQVELQSMVTGLADQDVASGAQMAEVEAIVNAQLAALGVNAVTAEEVDDASVAMQIPGDVIEAARADLPALAFDGIAIEGEFEDWSAYVERADQFLAQRGVDLHADPFAELLTPPQRAQLLRRIEDDFTFERCDCDKWEYAIAASCGAVGGLIDAFFVGLPGMGRLGGLSDEAVGGAVQKLARLCGWKGPVEGKDPLRGAIGFLEQSYRVPYDHRHASEVFAHIEKSPENYDFLNNFGMSTRNHHLKSLSHSPSPVGLFFSLLDQFRNTASFAHAGRVITIDAGDRGFKLQGTTFLSRLFCGFCNWFFHIVSDMAGSSGASGRGSGVPIPFFELFQFAGIGSFGKEGKTIAQLAVEVFEKGYDFRHGGAMAIPVVLVELCVRFLWTMKRHFHDQLSWTEASPFSGAPGLRRMLTVAYGSLCLVDLTDAGIRSGFEPVQMLLRMNLFAWGRFAGLGLREAYALFHEGQVDVTLLQEDIDRDLERVLLPSRA